MREEFRDVGTPRKSLRTAKEDVAASLAVKELEKAIGCGGSILHDFDAGLAFDREPPNFDVTLSRRSGLGPNPSGCGRVESFDTAEERVNTEGWR